MDRDKFYNERDANQSKNFIIKFVRQKFIGDFLHCADSKQQKNSV